MIDAAYTIFSMFADSEFEVPLSQIEIDPENIRTEYDPEILQGLRNALSIEGEFINPPVVYRIGEDRYRVRHGSTRVLAAQGVVKTLRVRVTDAPPSQTNKLLSQMSENLLQGSLRPADIGKALRRLRDADDKQRSLSQLVGALKAAGINRTKTWVSMHLAISEMDPGVQQLINQGKIGGEVAYQLRGLPRPQQLEWAGRIIRENMTFAQVRQELGLIGDPAEWDQAQIGTELAKAALSAQQADGRGGPRRPSDLDRRHGRAVSRWELIPVSAQEHDHRKLRPLETKAWVKTATDVEKQLAQEALFIGGYSAEQAIELVERAIKEAQVASESVMMALNAIRQLLECPAELPEGSALGELMSMRVRRLLHNLGQK
jgi:ParB-like chromosome segregation protein Spo0J